MSDPVVSVIIPVFNGAAVIGQTLASLSAQRFADWDAIVVDDGSTDATAAIVAAWPDTRIRLLCNPANAGPVVTRNRAVAEARGRYIAALDHDDLCHPDRLAHQVAWLDANPEIVALGTQARFLTDGVVGPSNYARRTSPALIAWLTWIENPLVWSSMMLRGDAARALRPFSRPDRVYAEDFDLYHRIQAQGGIARLDAALIVYRQHGGGISKQFAAAMRSSAAQVLAEAHGARCGAAAPRIAALLVRHNMAGTPVPDRPTLQDLAAAIRTLHAHFCAEHRPSSADAPLIAAETARRWHRIARTALRSGSLSLADVLAVPAPVGHADPARLLYPAAIGTVRRIVRR